MTRGESPAGRDRMFVERLVALPSPGPDLLGVLYSTAREHRNDWAVCERISAKALLLYPDRQNTQLRSAVAASIFGRSLERLGEGDEGPDRRRSAS